MVIFVGTEIATGKKTPTWLRTKCEFVASSKRYLSLPCFGIIVVFPSPSKKETRFILEFFESKFTDAIS